MLVKIYFLYFLGSMQSSLPLGILTFRLRKRTSLNIQATCTVGWNCVKMKMILLFWYDAARRYSDESCFIFEMHLLVDHSKIMVYKALLKRLSAWKLNHAHQFLSEEHIANKY